MSDADITFWFDPSCPFTWRASRWLRGVAQRRGLRIHWRLMSLSIVNEGKAVPTQYQEPMAQGVRAGRLLHAVGDQRGQDALARLYTEIGERVHWPSVRRWAGGTDRKFADMREEVIKRRDAAQPVLHDRVPGK